MILDGNLLFSLNQDLTVLAANTLTASTNVIDFSQARDMGVSEPLKIWGIFNVIPTSGTGGATITASLQTSPDNAAWTTLVDFPVQPLANFSATGESFLFRSQLPMSNVLYRYLRLGYTVSAVLTAGQIEAGMSLDTPRHPYYSRNYVA